MSVGNVPVHPLECQGGAARYRSDLVAQILSRKYTHVLCLAYHRDVQYDRLRYDIRRVLRTLTPSSHKRRNLLIEAEFFVERQPGNTHVHGLLNLSTPELISRFCGYFPEGGDKAECWNRIVPSGTYDAGQISDPAACAIYASKLDARTSDWTQRISSTDFA